MRAFKHTAVAVLLAASAALTFGACGSPIDEDASGSVTQEVKQALACGGIAGLACPAGQRCVDDPADDCDPRGGGADCIGVCKPGKPPKGGGKGCGKKDASKTYVAYGDQCQLVRFVCDPGSEYFSDACGCGCQTVGGGAACGNNVCGAGTYCCNASCGICAPLGGVCIQLACAP